MLEDLDSKQGYDRLRAFGNAKLGVLFMANKLRRLVKERNAKAQVVVAHPGYVNTGLQQRVWFFRNMTNPVLAQAADLGAMSIVLAATDEHPEEINSNTALEKPSTSGGVGNNAEPTQEGVARTTQQAMAALNKPGATIAQGGGGNIDAKGVKKSDTPHQDPAPFAGPSLMFWGKPAWKCHMSRDALDLDAQDHFWRLCEEATGTTVNVPSARPLGPL